MQNLVSNGYAQVGVCNDLTGLAQDFVLGGKDKVTMWPMVMNDALVVPELKKRAAGADGATYQKMLDIVNEMPSDAHPPAKGSPEAADFQRDAARRAAAAMDAWKPGADSLVTVSQSRGALLAAAK